jgi:hypothetical protein
VQHEKRNQRNTSVYSHSKNVLYDALAQAKKSVIGLGQQVDISPSPLPSLIVAPKNDISLGLKHSLCASQSKQIQENEPSEKLSSSGDTWPESEVHDTPEDHALPQYLLEIMRTGLKFETDSGISFDNLSNLRYWSLSELWGLLEQRKVSWSADSVKNQQAPPAPKMRDWGSTTEAIHLLPESIEPPPLELEYADANERIALSPNLRDASGPSGEVHSDLLGKEIQRDQHQKHERNSSDALSQAIEYSRISGALAQDHQSKPSAHALTNVEHFAGLSHQELLTSAPDLGLEQLNSVADDDLFYETLDAAYDAIIHTAAGGQEFALDAFEMPILLMSSKLNEANDFFATPNMVRPTSNVTPVQVVKTAQLRKPSPIATKAERERMGPELLGVDNCDGLPREFSEDKSCDQRKSLPWLIGYNNPQMSITTSRTLDQKQDPNLPDFWRQNKLY